jgi:hypothetical protein
LIIPILLSSSLLLVPAKDTVWWETAGGRVMEHQSDTDMSCSLMFYDDSGSVTFEWVELDRHFSIGRPDRDMIGRKQKIVSRLLRGECDSITMADCLDYRRSAAIAQPFVA